NTKPLPIRTDGHPANVALIPAQKGIANSPDYLALRINGYEHGHVRESLADRRWRQNCVEECIRRVTGTERLKGIAKAAQNAFRIAVRSFADQDGRPDIHFVLQESCRGLVLHASI